MNRGRVGRKPVAILRVTPEDEEEGEICLQLQEIDNRGPWLAVTLGWLPLSAPSSFIKR